MPEGPEIRRAADRIHQQIAGRRLSAALRLPRLSAAALSRSDSGLFSSILFYTVIFLREKAKPGRGANNVSHRRGRV